VLICAFSITKTQNVTSFHKHLFLGKTRHFARSPLKTNIFKDTSQSTLLVDPYFFQADLINKNINEINEIKKYKFCFYFRHAMVIFLNIFKHKFQLSFDSSLLE